MKDKVKTFDSATSSVEKTTKKHKGFQAGVSGNPKGRPKGAGLSITTEIKRKLKKKYKGGKATYLQKLIDSIMKKAIEDGDTQTQKQLWAYIDGQPTEKKQTEVKGGIVIRQIMYNNDYNKDIIEAKTIEIE